MDIIKYRAFDTANKRMVYGGFFIASNGIIWRDNDIHGLQMSGKKTISPSDRFIVMEITTGFDKLGTPIYEGDILRDDEYNELGEIIRDNGMWAVKWPNDNIEYFHQFVDMQNFEIVSHKFKDK